MKQTRAQILRLINLWLPVAAQMALIFYFSAQPSGSDVLSRFPFSALVGHLGGYFLLSLLFYRAFSGGLRQWRPVAAAWAVVCSILYGVSDEMHQYFVPGREPSWLDLLVDGAGACLAVIACRLWFHGRRSRAKNGQKERSLS